MNFTNVKTPVSTRTGGGVATGTAAAAAAASAKSVELTMYRQPPSGEVSVEEFEKYALDRLRGEPAFPRRGRKQWLVATLRRGMLSNRCLSVLVWHACAFAVLKAIEEAKLRSKADDDIQVSCGGGAAVKRHAGWVCVG